jgi:gamma-glutamylcyclotransferase
MDTDFLYFAYGSNLLSRRLRERTPSARVLGRGVLPDHVLRWHMRSNDGSGKCDVRAAEPHTPSLVHGVVYRIASAEKPLLDQAESLGVGYRDEQVTVQMDGRSVTAWIYRALRIDATALPYDWYKAVVIAGAHEHGLPDDYRALLHAVPAKTDPDGLRARRHFALVQQAAFGSLQGLHADQPLPVAWRVR